MLSFFHLYGLIVGLSIVVGWWLFEKKAREHEFWQDVFEKMGVIVLLAGLLGARAWHVITDWSLYSQNWLEIVAIWQGGLSIIGGVVGGSLGLILSANIVLKNQQKRLTIKHVFDAATFALPIAQCFGRLANYFNQELYGLPTNLPWAIRIDSTHRIAGYERSEFFHPLFAYEMIATGSFGVGLWLIDSRTNIFKSPKSFWKIGYGRLFQLYLLYYSVLRIALDFLRPNRGFNQLVLLMVASIMGVWLLWSWKKFKRNANT